MTNGELKIKLDTERTQLLTELSAIAVQHPKSGDWVAVPSGENLTSADRDLTADAVEEWNERRAILAQLEMRYKNVNRALAKFEDNTYGICEISGEVIENKRLEANPAARTNIANLDQEINLPL